MCSKRILNVFILSDNICIQIIHVLLTSVLDKTEGNYIIHPGVNLISGILYPGSLDARDDEEVCSRIVNLFDEKYRIAFVTSLLLPRIDRKEPRNGSLRH